MFRKQLILWVLMLYRRTVSESGCESVSPYQGCPSAAMYNGSEIQGEASACSKNSQLYYSNVTLIRNEAASVRQWRKQKQQQCKRDNEGNCV